MNAVDATTIGAVRIRLARASSDPATARERVVILSTWHPEPADNGRKQRTRQIVSALAKNCDVVLVSMLPPDALVDGPLPSVPDVWQQHTVVMPVYRSTSFRALAAGLRPIPRAMVVTWNRESSKTVVSIVTRSRASVVIGTDLRTLRYLVAMRRIAHTVLDEPDVSPFVVSGIMDRSAMERARATIRSAKYHHFLRSAGSRIDAVIVASDIEAQAYADVCDTPTISVVENGVSSFPAQRWTPPTNDDLLYTGSLTYGPNADATRWFAHDILPRVIADRPRARLIVTGAVPEALPAELQTPRVLLTGRLARLDDTYAASRVFVAPILWGTGTRVKLLEAMAHGLPIVSTSKGAEGLDIIPGEHMLIADNPEEFASATVRLLCDPNLSQLLGSQARELVAQRYNWTRQGETLCQIVSTLQSNDRRVANV